MGGKEGWCVYLIDFFVVYLFSPIFFLLPFFYLRTAGKSVFSCYKAEFSIFPPLPFISILH